MPDIILIYIHNVCLIHVAKKKARRTKSHLSNWRIDQVSKGNSIRTKKYGYTWAHLPRRWKEMAWATPMTDSTWLQGTRRHAPHFSQKARVFLSLSLSLSAIPSIDSSHPTFPYSLSRCIPLFSPYSHPPLLFIRVHPPSFRFSAAEIFNFFPSSAISVSPRWCYSRSLSHKWFNRSWISASQW